MFTDCCHYLLILFIYCVFNLSKLGFWWNVVNPEKGQISPPTFSAALQLYNILFTMCFFSAIACFMYSNLIFSNVFTNSNVNTPLLFQISTTWSNHEGSLLLWCWLLTLIGRTFYKEKKTSKSYKKIYRFRKAVLFRSNALTENSLYLIIVFFFCFFLIATSNPFLKNQFLSFYSIAELNPVLQDPVLAIHPPCIYTGYVASSVLFALSLCHFRFSAQFEKAKDSQFIAAEQCVAQSNNVIQILAALQRLPSQHHRFPQFREVLLNSLIKSLSQKQKRLRRLESSASRSASHKNADNELIYNDIWIQIRFWMCFCWIFLTLGILLGSWWAYHELGWGGWWFWDPVENASLMPWLFATACIHSVLLPKLNSWTLFFHLFTFFLSILGTFFVRSGLLASVHSFATDSTRGLFLLGFLVCIAGFGIILFVLLARKFSDYKYKLLPTFALCGALLRTINPLRAAKQQQNSILRRVAQNQIEQLLLLQNGFFLIFTAIVLCGTAAPILFQLLSNRDVSTGAPFFNGTLVPLVCCIMFMLIFVHSLILKSCFAARSAKLKTTSLYKKSSLTELLANADGQRFALSCSREALLSIFCIVHFCFFFFVGQFSVLESIFCILCFILFCLFFLSSKGCFAALRGPLRASFFFVRNRVELPTISEAISLSRQALLSSLSSSVMHSTKKKNVVKPIAQNMKLAHFGFLCFLIGVLLSNRKKTNNSLQMRPGFAAEAAEQRFAECVAQFKLGPKICSLRSIDQNMGPTFRSICGNIVIYQQPILTKRDEGVLSVLRCALQSSKKQEAFVMFPEIRFSFANPEVSTTKVAIHTNFLSDIYMLIGTGSSENGWFVTTMQLPFVFCIWIGFVLAAIAGLKSIALLSKQKRINWL